MGEKKSKEQAFMEYLRDGEQVCWHGVTKPFPLLERDAKVLILAKWTGSVVVSAIILGLYMGNNPDWSLKVAGVILLIAALLVVSPFMEKRSILGQEYWITDQRAILLSRDRTFYSIELSELDGFRLVEGKTREGTLVLGSDIFEDINRQLRWRACHPKTNVQSDGPSDRAQGLVFFSVSDSKKAADCLRQQMGRAA